MKHSLEEVLRSHQTEFTGIVPFDLNHENVVIFDFSTDNPELRNVDITDEESFTSYVFNKLRQNNSPVGVGGYNEDRIIYQRSEVFTKDEVRSVHLGFDIWAEAGTPVYAPLDGVVHSFKNNCSHGDYGPTIILEHHLHDHTFYTLYGHLSVESLDGLREQMEIPKGTEIARLGTYEENVHWPPHLHFQVIKNMNGHIGDFPGVATRMKRLEYLEICPDPNLILGIKKLN